MIRKTSAGDSSELEWFKSSYSSSGDGNDCVEVALDWRKSSYSSSSEGDSCVEIATTPGTIHIRDSKSRSGPQLAFAPKAWAGFVSYAAAAGG
ncbi:DUF397 domain-containing protein [Streptomyces violascens]|uniref:DUF397 domain-containing protein n=1 Tax=Streptomyces violascens TaxID=67381 RepID=UPI003667457D